MEAMFLRRAREILHEKGWVQGTTMTDDGQVCLGYAFVLGAGVAGQQPLSLALDGFMQGVELTRVVNEQFPDRIHHTDRHPVVSFNDCPSTTFEDVERVLEKAIVEYEGRVIE